MSLKELRRNWDLFGRTDPLWAILTDPEAKGGRWDEAAFFQRGVDEIEQLLAELGARRAALPQRRALDFGCGVGRLSQALAAHCELVDGVDIAASMIALAGDYNRAGERCRYHLNERDDLALFEDDAFDLVYSNIVLQHMQPRYAKRYLVEFVRVLAPGGWLVFQLPSEQVQTARDRRLGKRLERAGRRLTPRALRAWFRDKRQPRMEVYGVPRAEVLALLESRGARVVDVVDDRSAGERWRSHRYFVTK